MLNIGQFAIKNTSQKNKNWKNDGYRLSMRQKKECPYQNNSILLTILGQVLALSWPGRMVLDRSPGTTSWSFRSS